MKLLDRVLEREIERKDERRKVDKTLSPPKITNLDGYLNERRAARS